MRTTIALPDPILDAVRREALARHVSISRYIAGAVQDKLAQEARESKEAYRPLVTYKGQGLKVGVDLNDTAGLLELMDGER